MEQLKKKVRIVPMTNEYLNDVAELERTCFSNPWSRNMLAEELENACSAFLVALDAENGSVVGYAGLMHQLRHITQVAFGLHRLPQLVRI